MSTEVKIPISDAEVVLKKGAGRSVKAGGPWVYDNEIDCIRGSYENGDIIKLVDFDGYFLGYGFINDRSVIRIRLLSRRRDEEVTPSLIKKRVRAAWDYRKKVMRRSEDLLACRMIFGEADLLPGITVDRFGSVLVIESLALGTDRIKGLILDACLDVLSEPDTVSDRTLVDYGIGSVRTESDNNVPLLEEPDTVSDRILVGYGIGSEAGESQILTALIEEDSIAVTGIYERSDAKVREAEGLPRIKGFIGDTFDTRVEIVENAIRYIVDVENGQKTGFFLDQKYNRLAVRGLCRGGRVLDCFTHTGSFAINAAFAGALEVLAVDSSDTGIAQAMENAELNGVSDRIRFERADVFDFLPELERRGELFDVVILDPPAFTKSRASIKKAVTGYREINLRGIRLVKNGGFLATCSCSHFMEPSLFAKTIQEAARGAHRRLKQVEFRTQAPDHPILWTGSTGTENSYYLKFYIFQVFDW